jgi:adenylosuccinate synthase
MPGNAQKYVMMLEEMMGVTIEYVSVGPGRKQTFKK